MSKILVVEDEIDIRENLKLLLVSEGYDVIIAENGLNAWHILQDMIPDIIISDIMMPHIDGFELFRRVSKKFNEKFIPFIFLTAKNDPYSIRRGMNLGADDYITKPFSEEELLTAIRIRLEKYNSFNNRIKNVYENISKYVPHELRTPLVAIMGYSELILSDVESLKQNEITEMADRINYASKRLYSRIEKFIQFSETDLIIDEQDKKEVTFCAIDEDIIKEVIRSNYLAMEREGDFSLTIETGRINMPERCMKLLLNELFENSVKFSEEGKEVLVKGKSEGQNYLVEITDFGIGMTNEEINQLGVFNQINRDVFQQEGNGLGLAIVISILNKYNGEIRFTSEKERFTTIDILLKLAIQ